MPVTSPALTQRLFLHYTSAGKPHQLCFRPITPQTEPVLEGMAAEGATLLADYMLNFDSFVSAEYAGATSNVRFPLAFTTVAGSNTSAGNVYADDPESVMVSMTGKGRSAGVKWSQKFFTSFNWLGSVWATTNRWSLSTAPVQVLSFFDRVQTMYSTTGLTGIQLVCAGSQPVIINNWVNISHSGYWTRKQRT